jgi:hypothetical protein
MLRWKERVLSFSCRYGRTSIVAGDIAGRLTWRIDRCDQLLNDGPFSAGNEWAAKPFQGSGSGRSVIPSLFSLKVRRIVQLQRGVERSREPFVRPHQRGLRRPSIDEPDELPVALHPGVAELGELVREFPTVLGAVHFARSCSE